MLAYDVATKLLGSEEFPQNNIADTHTYNTRKHKHTHIHTLTVLIRDIVDLALFLRSICCSFLCSKSSVTVKADRSFFIFYISIARS